MIRAAFLVRCSTNKQDYERQLDDLSRVCRRFGFTNTPDIIFGEHITGKDRPTIRDRKSIKDLKKAAEEHLFDVVLISEVSRLSRDSLGGRLYVQQFVDLGIPMYFRDKDGWTIDLNTRKVKDAFIRELGTYFDGAADYLKSMKTQIASGRRRALRKSELVVGHIPLGYKKLDKDAGDLKNHIVVDPETAPIVQDIFNSYLAEGASMKSLALLMSARYGKRFTVSGIQQVLARDLYYSGKYTIYMNDPDDPDLEPEPFEVELEAPLIDKETYDKATEKRKVKRNSRDPYPKQEVHLLTKLIRCRCCNHAFSPLKRSSDKPNERYRMFNGKVSLTWKCMSRINNAFDCTENINLNGDKLEILMWNFFKNVVLVNANLNEEQRQIKISEQEEKLKGCIEEIEAIDENLLIEDKMQQRAYRAYITAPEGTEDVALEIYNQTLQEVTKEKASLNNKKDFLQRQITECNDKIAFYQHNDLTEEYIAQVEKSEALKRDLFLKYIKSITPYKVQYRIVVLLVTTTSNEAYYVLMNANQKHHEKAYWLSAILGWWTDAIDNNDYYKNNDLLGLFHIPDASMFYLEPYGYGEDDLDAYLSYKEMEEVLAGEGNVIRYDIDSI